MAARGRAAEPELTGRVTRAARRKASDSEGAADEPSQRKEVAPAIDTDKLSTEARGSKRAKKATTDTAEAKVEAGVAPEPEYDAGARKPRAKAAKGTADEVSVKESAPKSKPRAVIDDAPVKGPEEELEEPVPAPGAKRKTAARSPNRHQRAVGEAVPAAANEETDEETVAPEPPAAKGKGKAAVSGATRALEQSLWAQGYEHVVGVDEAGRGPLAGPVVAAACCLPPDVTIPGVADSKQLDEQQREELYDVIVNTPGLVWAVAHVDHTIIDRINILQATLKAMTDAVNQLPSGKRDYLLVDGNRLPKTLPAPARAVVQGDSKVFCIAAASILAKVTRDRMMVAYHEQYPSYNFAQHKGYAVPAHYAALKAHGPCLIHRRSFQPIRGMTNWTREAQLEEEAKAREEEDQQREEKD